MVLDLNMPDMHGLEVLGFVRANQKFQQLPVLVLTTRDDAVSRTAAMQAGATCYLTKPFTPQALAHRSAWPDRARRRRRAMTDFLDSFLDDYFAEAEEHLAVIRRALLTLEQSVGQRRIDGGILEELFRSFHSLKGIAGMVDHRETEALAHELESYLRALREGDAILTATGMDLLIKGAGALEASIAARRANETARDTDPIVAEIQALIERDGAAQPAATAASRGQR